MSIVLLSVTMVLAWFVFLKTSPLATFKSGQIDVSVNINAAPIQEELAFNDLAFMDFSSDIIADDDEVLNLMASITQIKINNSLNSSDVNTQLSIDPDEGLFYLLYYEGKNLTPAALDYNWHNLIVTVVGSETNVSAQRNLLATYNAGVIADIASIKLEPGDWITLQIAVWGDYEELSAPSLYLSDSYDMLISIASTQWEGAIWW